jgi:hypothetical protein
MTMPIVTVSLLLSFLLTVQAEAQFGDLLKRKVKARIEKATEEAADTAVEKAVGTVRCAVTDDACVQSAKRRGERPTLLHSLAVDSVAPSSTPGEGLAAQGAQDTLRARETAQGAGIHGVAQVAGGALGGSPARLAAALTEAPDLMQAFAVAETVLALGGLATSDLASVLMQPSQPAASSVVLPQEVLNLALEARNRATAGRLTVDELGRMLKDFGWPFLPESPPGNQLMRLLATWVTEARGRPQDPLSFTPLFLTEMAKRQRPAVDIGADSTTPHSVRLTLLELQLFAAAFEMLVRPVLYTAAGPCDQAKDWLGKTPGGQFVGGLTPLIYDPLLEKGLAKIGIVTKKTAEHLGRLNNVFDAVTISMRIFKLISMTSDRLIEVRVASDNPVHKDEPTSSGKSGVFIARAGVTDAEYEQWRRAKLDFPDFDAALHDCLAAAGLPDLTSAVEQMKDAKNWRVKWHLEQGSPEHAQFMIRDNEWLAKGHQIMAFKEAGRASAEAKLTVLITNEKSPGHRGVQASADVVVRADVLTTQMPNLSTFTGAAVGGLGLAASIVDLAASWAQDMFPPSSYGTLRVTYHDAHAPLMLTFETVITQTFEESSEEGMGQFTWTMRAEVPLAPGKRSEAGDSLWFEGGAPVVYSAGYRGASGGCPDRLAGSKAEGEVRARLLLKAGESVTQAAARAAYPFLYFTRPKTVDRMVVVDPVEGGGCESISGPSPGWEWAWDFMHEGELAEGHSSFGQQMENWKPGAPAPIFRLGGWDVEGADVIKKEYDRKGHFDDSGEHVAEKTTIRIKQVLPAPQKLVP